MATMLLVSACITDDTDDPGSAIHECAPIPKDRADRDLLEAIDAMGLCGSSAVEVGDGYLVEGDIHVARSTLTDKQARWSTLVSAANVRDITVRVDAAIPADGGVDDWRGAVQGAIDVWNAVPNNLVRMQLVTAGPADITVRSDFGDLGDQTAADADWPVSGQPGPEIQVNLDFNQNVALTDGQKLFLAVHELGHCLGLRHTNWAALHEATGIQISGTPQTDSASVMNGLTAGDEFAGLSPNDSLAIRTIYPEIVTMIVEYTGCTSGTPRMAATWGGTLVQSTLEWQLDRYVGGTWSQVYRGTGGDWTFNVPTGTSLKLRVRGRSNEGWSFYRTVTQTAPSCSTLPP